jgi:hypothetical protein
MAARHSTWVRLGWLTLAATALSLFAFVREAGAVPSFARKYQTSCTTCHTIYPMLNPFGEAFRRNGYRFPSQGGANDTDATRANVLALGQEEYKKRFPNAVWPASIAQEIPLGIMFNGAVTLNVPGQDAEAAAGNNFNWSGILTELHIFGAGSINENLTYFTQVTIAGPNAAGIDLETGYLLWNDIVGPTHAVNLWIGRLFKPSLDSFGLHSSYLNDTRAPGISVFGLFNSAAAAGGPFIPGQGHSDGIELNGILGHRFDWSLGWLASGTLNPNAFNPNASDVYAHVGVKLGGMSLDGEGPGGAVVPDANKPWAETAVALDLFAYAGKQIFDNGTGIPSTAGLATPIRQDDNILAFGGSAHVALGSLLLTSGLTIEQHSAPFLGQPYTPASADGTTPAAAGANDGAKGTSMVQYNELDYVIFPWFVPGIRTEYTRLQHGDTSDDANTAQLFRFIPGISMAVRPNIRTILSGSFETAKGTPMGGGWGPAGASIVNPNGVSTKLRAETITLTFNVAY